MKNFKHILFLSILCSLVLFTNCGEDEGEGPFYTPQGLPVADGITSKPTLTITISPSGGGSVSPQGGTYDAGTTVELTATANVDYTFTGWTGDFTGSSNPVTLTMLTNQTVIANYEFHDADGDGVGDSVDNCAETPSDATADENGCSNSNEIYLDENGVTMKATEDAIIGEIYGFNGANYLVVDRDLLKEMVINQEDVTYVVTSNITDMTSMFAETGLLFGNISSWDVSNVTTMFQMLNGTTSFEECCYGTAERFNQDLSAWDVSNVTNMAYLFYGAPYYGGIEGWNVSSVYNMQNMFSYWYVGDDGRDIPAINIDSWDVSNVLQMRAMFESAYDFNTDISSWDVSSVGDVKRMFRNATAFNQDLSSWNVENVVFCPQVFENTTAWTEPKPNFTNCTP